MSNAFTHDPHGRRVARTALACAMTGRQDTTAVRAVLEAAAGDTSVLTRAHLHCLTAEDSDPRLGRLAAALVLRARGTRT